jgi:PPK2 family polyphosphate:nucleotide phosphotransferase
MIRETEPYRVKPGQKVNLSRTPTRYDGKLSKADTQASFRKLLQQMDQLQELMYAEHKRSLIVVLQGMDAAGKDSTIRRVFGPLNPQGCRVMNFKAPGPHELSHDYLWRVHLAMPPRGYVAVFNRSHYEDVLVARVKDLVPRTVWRKRYDHINDFERMADDEGFHFIKFFLHISRDYQKRRLQRRLEDPAKHWKFDPADLAARSIWPAYRKAYEDALSRCSTERCPWYVIPAERRWYRNLLIASILVQHMQAMKMKMPKADFDPAEYVIE